jgi:hypothetical protein
MQDKYFTPDEADVLIPKLEQIVSNMLDQRKAAIGIGEELQAMQDRIQAGENVIASDLINKRTELDFIVEIIQEGLNQIEDLGGQPKDLDLGLVDFPAVLDGQEILLCWRYGEKSIRYYHAPEDGYAGRKPLPSR